jgi:hypothetical protein
MGIGLYAAVVPAVGHASGPKKASTPWSPPLTSFGQPDLQGNWSHNSATPLQRPKELEGRAFLTAKEIEALQKSAGELFNGETDAAFGDSVFLAALHRVQGTEKNFTSTDTTGNYNHSWIVDRDFFDTRTSLISDPADGRMPALTLAAQQREAAAAKQRQQHPFDGPEDIALSQRCITGTVPMIQAGYNNYYQIAQAPGYVAIYREMRHDTRVIPLDGSPHPSKAVRQWLGDARGHWEGNTLVIDTANFSGKAEYRVPGDENMHLVERLTRIDAGTLKYEVTFDDLTTYTRPWTVTTFFKATKDKIYEYACHEGNVSMGGTLGGARRQEREAVASR